MPIGVGPPGRCTIKSSAPELRSENFQRVSPCGKLGANRCGSASLPPPAPLRALNVVWSRQSAMRHSRGMFGSAVLRGPTKVAMPAIDKIAFVFNLLLRIIGGDGFLSASRPLTNEHSSYCPLAKFVHREAGETARLPSRYPLEAERLANATCFDAEIVPWHAGGGFPPLA